MKGQRTQRTVRKATLTPGRRRLLELMQEINFGRINELIIRDGEPVFDPPPHVVRKIKMRGKSGARSEACLADFTLKKEVTSLFEKLDGLGNGTVKSIEIKHGLPFSMEIEKQVRA